MKCIFKLFFQIMVKFITYVGISLAVIFTIYTLYAIPAMISLPGGIRPGLEEQTIKETVHLLDRTDLDGLELIEEARFFRILSGWGSATINAHRYYTSGSD